MLILILDDRFSQEVIVVAGLQDHFYKPVDDGPLREFASELGVIAAVRRTRVLGPGFLDFLHRHDCGALDALEIDRCVGADNVAFELVLPTRFVFYNNFFAEFVVLEDDFVAVVNQGRDGSCSMPSMRFKLAHFEVRREPGQLVAVDDKVPVLFAGLWPIIAISSRAFAMDCGVQTFRAG